MAALPDPEVRMMVELQDPTTVHRAAECAARLTFLRRSNRASERTPVTVRQAEVQDQERPEDEIGRMLRKISRQLTSLTGDRVAERELRQFGPGMPSGRPDFYRAGPGERGAPSGYRRGPFLGSCYRCGRRGHSQRDCRQPYGPPPPDRLRSPERRGPPVDRQAPERGPPPQPGPVAVECAGN